ncbi:hypothetical protein AgCh_014681 [Apium graveolens]
MALGPRQRPRRRGDRSNRERLDDVFLPGLHWQAIPARDREQDSKRAYLCSLLLHQARKFKDNLEEQKVRPSKVSEQRFFYVGEAVTELIYDKETERSMLYVNKIEISHRKFNSTSTPTALAFASSDIYVLVDAYSDSVPHSHYRLNLSVCPGIHPSTKPEQKGKAKPAKEKRDRHDYSILKLESILRTTSDNIRPVSPGDSVLLRLLTEFLPTKLEAHSAFAGASCVASNLSL